MKKFVLDKSPTYGDLLRRPRLYNKHQQSLYFNNHNNNNNSNDSEMTSREEYEILRTSLATSRPLTSAGWNHQSKVNSVRSPPLLPPPPTIRSVSQSSSYSYVDKNELHDKIMGKIY